MLEKTLRKWLTMSTHATATEILKVFEVTLRDHELTVKPGKWIFFKSKKENQPLLLAHIDTINTHRAGEVFPSNMDIVTETNYDIIGTPHKVLKLNDANSGISCLGTDDRAGIAVIDYITENLRGKGKEIPSVLFTFDEEIGCLGAHDFVASHDELDASFMLEFDRQDDDVVFYNTESALFKNRVSIFLDKAIGIGSVSDVAQLQTAYKINGANVSVGYSKQHTTNESIDMDILNKTAVNALSLLENKQLTELLGIVPWEEKVIRPAYGGYWSNPMYSGYTADKVEITKPKPVEKEKRDLSSIEKVIAELRITGDDPEENDLWIDAVNTKDAEGIAFTFMNEEELLYFEILKGTAPKKVKVIVEVSPLTVDGESESVFGDPTTITFAEFKKLSNYDTKLFTTLISMLAQKLIVNKEHTTDIVEDVNEILNRAVDDTEDDDDYEIKGAV